MSGKGAKDYMDIQKFNEFGVNVTFQEFEHPIYIQKSSTDFIPGLSILDVLFNQGVEETKKLYF